MDGTLSGKLARVREEAEQLALELAVTDLVLAQRVERIARALWEIQDAQPAPGAALPEFPRVAHFRPLGAVKG